MSLIEASVFPRRMFDWDGDWWLSPGAINVGPSTLDIFDPYDELDRLMSRNLLWLNQPEYLTDVAKVLPRVPEKHRITVDCTGFNPKSIKTEIKDNKLIVTGHEGSPHETQDFTLKEFRRTYDLPKNVETDKLVSFVTAGGQLVIEFPIKREEKRRGDLLPKIVDAEGGRKKVELNVVVPENIDPNKITVTCKDRDVIVKADYKVEKGEGVSRVHYYRRSTLPETTDFNSVKCVFDNNTLNITAPISEELEKKKSIPIEFVKKSEKSSCSTCQTPIQQQKSQISQEGQTEQQQLGQSQQSSQGQQKQVGQQWQSNQGQQQQQGAQQSQGSQGQLGEQWRNIQGQQQQGEQWRTTQGQQQQNNGSQGKR